MIETIFKIQTIRNKKAQYTRSFRGLDKTEKKISLDGERIKLLNSP